MAKSDSAIIDCDDMPQKRAFMQTVGSWRGSVKVTWKACKPIRSLSANSYYHVGIVEPFKDFLIEQYGDPRIDHDQAHESLVEAVLGTRNKTIGGATITIRPSTHDMNVTEFNEYVELAIAFLAEFCNIAVVPSDLFKVTRERGQTISTQIQL